MKVLFSRKYSPNKWLRGVKQILFATKFSSRNYRTHMSIFRQLLELCFENPKLTNTLRSLTPRWLTLRGVWLIFLLWKRTIFFFNALNYFNVYHRFCDLSHNTCIWWIVFFTFDLISKKNVYMANNLWINVSFYYRLKRLIIVPDRTEYLKRPTSLRIHKSALHPFWL